LRLVFAGAVLLGLSGCEDEPTAVTPGLTTTVDQAFEPGAANALVGIGQVGAYAQTFTVGKTGTLEAVDLLLVSQGGNDLIRVDIRGAANGNPHLDDGVVLGSRLVTAASLPMIPSQTFVTIDFAGQDIPCVAGQTLAIVLIRAVGSGGSSVLWITENEPVEDYAAGTSLQRNGGSGTAWMPFASDFYFRTRVFAP
jgi:hypothetical protein